MPQYALGSVAATSWRVSQTTADLARPPVPVRAVEFAAEPQSLKIDLAKTACLVIDMQNDFCTRGGWLDLVGADVTLARRPVQPLLTLLPMLREALVPILWVNWGNRPDRLNLSPSQHHVYDPAGDGVGLGKPAPATGSPVLEKGGWGAAIIDELVPHHADIHVDKYRMSGFWDTPLDSILRNLGATTLLFAGVNSDQCVMCTLQDANFLGYDCILLDDCAATTSPQFCADATRYNVKQCFGFVGQSSDLIAGMIAAMPT